jgi:hypothetical protein
MKNRPIYKEVNGRMMGPPSIRHEIIANLQQLADKDHYNLIPKLQSAVCFDIESNMEKFALMGEHRECINVTVRLPFEITFFECSMGMMPYGLLLVDGGKSVSVYAFSNHRSNGLNRLWPEGTCFEFEKAGGQWTDFSDCLDLSPGLTEDDYVAHTKYVDTIAKFILSVLEVINCSNVNYRNVYTRPKSTKKVDNTRRNPTYSHKILCFDHEYEHSGGCATGMRSSPRLHLRRGHIRKLPNGTQVWIQPALVGDKTKGLVTKDYRLNE